MFEIFKSFLMVLFVLAMLYLLADVISGVAL